MNEWICLITTLPTENATARMRAWRALKASGAAVLRDGVYLMPPLPDCRAALDAVAQDLRHAGGTAHVLTLQEGAGDEFSALFDREQDYANLLGEILDARQLLSENTAQEALKQARKLRKMLIALNAIDFFPTQAQRQAEAAMQELELACVRAMSSDEPQAVLAEIAVLPLAKFQGKVWATRARPWVDRLACAWLIQRFIDPKARFIWLEKTSECPARAIGYDFDGARFSHVGDRVTFEVLMASFELTRAGLHRMGHLVHFLDVGGIPPAEAVGVEAVLAGLRETVQEDDQLIRTSGVVFDGLLQSFETGVNRGD